MPLVRVVLTTDTDLVPCVKVRVVRELVVSPRVTEVLPTVTLVFPKVTVVLLQEIEVFPQEMAYLVLRMETLPLVKVVLLDKNVVFHSLFESVLGCLAVLGVFAAAPDILSSSRCSCAWPSALCGKRWLWFLG